MEIEFDPAKDEANFVVHGLRLTDAMDMDLEEAAIVVDARVDYGERRYRAFGRIDGVGHCLVFTWRPGKLRLISFRRAHEKEMSRYGR